MHDSQDNPYRSPHSRNQPDVPQQRASPPVRYRRWYIYVFLHALLVVVGGTGVYVLDRDRGIAATTAALLRIARNCCGVSVGPAFIASAVLFVRSIANRAPKTVIVAIVDICLSVVQVIVMLPAVR